MKQFILIALMLVLLPAIVSAQEHTTPESNQARTKPQSQTYVSDQGRYSILFPSEPELSTQNMTAPTGDETTQYLATSFVEGTLFMVGYFDYGSGIVFSLDKARDGMVSSFKGTLIEERSISLGGAPGRQLKIYGRADNGTEFMNRARFYDVRPRVFVLQCMVVKAQDGPAAAEKCESFFDSFKVKQGL